MKMIAVMVASVMLMSGSVGAATVIQTTTRFPYEQGRW